jgi:hypothetical protein
MSTTIQITSDNYDGQTAVITFTPDNGGPVVNIGSQVLPYNYTSTTITGLIVYILTHYILFNI